MLCAEWVRSEFAEVDLGDKRLNARLCSFVSTISKQPGSSICKASSSWREAKGNYRLLGNKLVLSEKILEPHICETKRRSSNFDFVLAIQDSCHLSFDSRPDTVGLGPIAVSRSSREVNGLMMHTAIALSHKGEPLGILAQDVWARKSKEQRKKKTNADKYKSRRQHPREKESNKWSKLAERYGVDNSANWVTVCDREADIYEFMRNCLDNQSDFLIRATRNRSINKSSRRAEDHTWLWPHLCKESTVGNYSIDAKKIKREEDAQVSIRFAKITMNAPANRTQKAHGKNLRNIEMSAVYVCEESPPEGEEPLNWMLLTSLPINSFEGAYCMAKWYSYRWEIEHFHKILKSGCNIEKAQLRDAESLKKLIAIKSVIAWRIHKLARMEEEKLTHACEPIFEEHEWKAAYCKINKTSKTPATPPKLGDMILWVAKLGGFLGRKSDGKPGIVSLWKGLSQLSEMSEIYRILNTS